MGAQGLCFDFDLLLFQALLGEDVCVSLPEVGVILKLNSGGNRSSQCLCIRLADSAFISRPTASDYFTLLYHFSPSLTSCVEVSQCYSEKKLS